VAGLAEAYQAMLAPHNARCMLSTALNVQFDAATRNVFIQETFDDFHVPWARSLFEGLPTIVDGHFEIPDSPGLGVEIDE
jgi:galactonate dehydratase